jgi:hypothetical protein
VDNTGLSSLQQKKRSGTLSAEDIKTAQAVYDTALVNQDVYEKNAAAFSLEGARSIFEQLNAARTLLDEVRGLGGANKVGGAAPLPSPAQTRNTQSTAQTYVVKIDLGGGRTRDVNVASANDANTLISALREARLAA